jgi:DNA polymerase delta subunit 1
MEFQVTGWHDDDVALPGEAASSYRVFMFGTDAEGRTCCAHLAFRPFFYLRLDHRGDAYAQQLRAALHARMRGGTERFAVVERRPFMFYHARACNFARLTFRTLKAFRVAHYLLREGFDHGGFRYAPGELDVYEYNVPPLIRAMHTMGVRSTGWCRAEIYADGEPEEPLSTCDRETQLRAAEDARPIERETAPIVMATFDIEVFSAASTRDDSVFPDFRQPDDVVTQVVTMFSRIGEDRPWRVHAAVLARDADARFADDAVRAWLDARGLQACKAHVAVCRSERALLDAWAEEMAARRATVWCHFNGLGFDEEYLFERAARVGADAVMRLGLLAQHEMALAKTQMESAAYGFNQFAFMRAPGVFHLDLMVGIKRDYKLESYSLDACAAHFLGERKDDLAPQDMFDLFRAHAADGLLRVLEYCLQDVLVTFRLESKLGMAAGLLEMAGQSWVPVDYLITRGQQIKGFSCIVRATAEEGRYLLRTVPRDEAGADAAGFQGATVLEPIRGAYRTVVACMDFASLYPSIMRAHNLSHETLLRDGDDPPPGVDVEAVDLGGGRAARFVRASTTRGVLCRVLETWAADRKVNKREMMRYERLAHAAPAGAERARLKFLESVYDARQKANKVCMNSLYGFTGVARGGMQACPVIAACVTAIGRAMIERTKLECERMLPGSRVVYGDTDSVFWELWPDRTLDDHPRAVHDAFEYCERAAERLSALFPAPNALEFEKCYSPLLLYDKKRYSGLMFSADLGADRPKKVDTKGLQLVRRDTVPYVRRCLKEVLDAIMHQRDPLAAGALASRYARDLLQHRVDAGELVGSKKLASRYKATAEFHTGEKRPVVVKLNGDWASGERSGTAVTEPGRPWAMYERGAARPVGTVVVPHPHVHVALLMARRSGGGGPRAGDRVPYVFVEKPRARLQIERAEDPAYVAANGVRLDVLHYFEHSVRRPLEAVFSVFMADPYATLLQADHRAATNANNRQTTLQQFFQRL